MTDRSRRRELPWTLALAACATALAAPARSAVEAVPTRAAPTLPPGSTLKPAERVQGTAALEQIAADILRGDASAALPALRALPPDTLSAAEQVQQANMLAHLGEPAGLTDGGPDTVPVQGLAAEVTVAYRRYWRHALLTPADRDAASRGLATDLRQLLVSRHVSVPSAASSVEDLEPLLIDQLERGGWHVVLGITMPLHELMLWRTQTLRRYTVVLPETTEAVEVALLEDFGSAGWSAWASGGRASAGGWADDGRLYAIRQRYPDLDGELFRVSLLGHEAQHFADLRRYRDLPSWTLEYRAKLTELALADETMPALLTKFRNRSGTDPSTPHPYANRQVLEDLRTTLDLPDLSSLMTAPRAAVRDAATRLLQADSRRRAAAPSPAASMR